jgi:hypothetical protein
MWQDEVSGLKTGTRNRAWYETVKSKYPSFQPSLGSLRQERVLKNNQSSYVFDFKTADPTGRSVTERLLAVTDSFGANTLMLGLAVRQKSRPSANKLLTYPAIETIAAAFSGSTSEQPNSAAKQAASDLEVVYNGNLSLQIATNSIFDGLDARRFRHVPATQQGVFASQNQSDYLDGAVAIEPQIFLDGTQANKLQVEIPTFAGMAIEPDNPDFELVLVLVASGFRVQGGSDLKR